MATSLDSSIDPTDHRIALMQKWAADPALMAQAGLLGSSFEATHLGIKPVLEESHAIHQEGKKKKRNKKSKGSVSGKLKQMSVHEKEFAYQLMMERSGVNHNNQTPGSKKSKKHDQITPVHANEIANDAGASH